MLITVAALEGADVFALLDRPLWQLLYTFHHVQARDTRRALDRRLERVDAGFMTAHAFNEPARLDEELRSVREAIADEARGPVSVVDDLAALRARGEALIARIEAGRVLSEGALVS